MKNVWVVFQCRNEHGMWACYKRVRGYENLKKYAELDMVWSMNIVGTEKTAKEYVDHWNESFKKNGTANEFMIA